jgi:protease-4
MLFGSFLTNIGLTAALLSGSAMEYTDYPVDAEPDFDEIWSHGYGQTKVVRIDLSGLIMRGRRERLFGSEPDMVESILSQILAARLDPAVRAILLEVDSPGGAVTPSDEIYAALRKFKESAEDRMVLVFIRDLGASGAYYAAMAGDYIMAEPTAIVGSVGVIMQTLNMKGLADKIGLTSVTIASGANKDMLNPLKEVDPVHVDLLQELVDEMQNRFSGIVMDSRGIENQTLLDGRVFTAKQALEHNLIDGIGYWPEAIEQVKLELGVEDVYIVRYAEKMGFLDALFASKSPRLPDINAMEAPRFLYLWKP